VVSESLSGLSMKGVVFPAHPRRAVQTHSLDRSQYGNRQRDGLNVTVELWSDRLLAEERHRGMFNRDKEHAQAPARWPRLVR